MRLGHLSDLTVILRCFRPGTRGASPLVFQRVSESVGIQPPAEERPRADVIADLPGGYKQVQRAPLAILLGPMVHHGPCCRRWRAA